MADIDVIILANHPSASWSMHRYAAMLKRAYEEAGLRVRVVKPTDVMSRRVGKPSVKKFVAYVESLVIFPLRAAWACRGGRVVHISDHSNGLWLLFARYAPKSIVTCHDLIALRAARGEIPEHRTRPTGRIYQALVAAGLRRARRIVAVSHATADEVRELFPQADISVVHNPVEPGLRGDPSAVPSRSLPHYALIVSTPGWRKRREHAIAVWRHLRKEEQFADVPLHVVGSPLTPVERASLSAEESEHVTVMTGLDDVELVGQYAHSSVLIQASRYEGFGWPIVEANSHGTPALCADRAVFREVAGQAGRFVADDLAHEPWAELAEWLSSEEASTLALSNAERFRWEHFVDRLVEEAGTVGRGGRP